MIELAPTRTFLDRFARELEAQAPFAVIGEADLARGTPLDAEAARIAWAGRVVDEYRSVVVFTELLGHLAAIEAPFAMLGAVHRLIGDELRHAKLCAEVSSFFGPLDELEIDLGELALPPSDDPPARRALDIVARELVVAESESVRAMAAYRDATSDPACRAALSLLLADEVRHAATGRALLDRLIDFADPAEVAPLIAQLPAIMAMERAHVVREHARFATDGPGRMFGASIRPHEAPSDVSR